MKYRSEIDGLRALAVLPVIFYHAGFSLFSGGFVGVDVFFVISGFLITSLIVSDLEQGHYSIRQFYARRARRILPALFVVMLASIPFAYGWMLPSQLEDFSQSLIAVTLFISNIFFWSKSGYFAPEASEKPLLHTWSLGVEEQFYVLFPLLLMLLWRFARGRVLPILIALAIAGLIACDLTSRVMPSANFYLLPTRAWELLVGSVAACCAASLRVEQRNDGGALHHALSLLGLVMILASVFWFDDHMRLPSLWMLIPVAGTALVLFYGTMGSAVARLLSWKPLVGIGLISYSAYLWHHPLFAFARIAAPASPSTPLMLTLSAASLLLGALSWWWVEQPFRQKSHPRYVANTPALRLAVITAMILVMAGAAGHFTRGNLQHWQTHAPENQRTAYRLLEAARTAEHYYDNGDCVFNVTEITPKTEARLAQCFKKYGPGLALIGDSHAINLFGLMRQQRTQPFIAGISQGMCRPHSPKATCYYDALLAMLARQPTLFRTIIYEQAGWHLLTNAPGREIDERDLHGLTLDARVPDYAPHTGYIEAVKHYLLRLVPYAQVIWLGPHLEPQIRQNVVVRLGCDHAFTLRPNQAKQYERLDTAIAQALAGSPIRYHSQLADMQFDMAKDFMNCDAVYFSDTNHYSPKGEKYFGARLNINALLRGDHE